MNIFARILLVIVDLIAIVAVICESFDFFIFQLPVWLSVSIFIYMIIRSLCIFENEPWILYRFALFCTFYTLIFVYAFSYSCPEERMQIYSENGYYGIKSIHSSHIFANAVYDTIYPETIISKVFYDIPDSRRGTKYDPEKYLRHYEQKCFFLKKDDKWGIINYYGTIFHPIYDSISVDKKYLDSNKIYFNIFKCYTGDSIKIVDFLGNAPADTIEVRYHDDYPVSHF